MEHIKIKVPCYLAPQRQSLSKEFGLYCFYFFVYIVNLFSLIKKRNILYIPFWSMYHSLNEMSSKINTYSFSLYLLNSVVFLCMNKLFNQSFIDG